MRTSQLINPKSLVRQCRERREQKAVSARIRKALIAVIQITMYAYHIISINIIIKDMMGWIFPKPIKTPLLLPEGKPHLN